MNQSAARHPDIAQELGARIVDGVAGAFGLQITLEQAVIRESTRERGCDYQSNAAMALAKRLERPSGEVAQELVDHLDVGDLCEPPQVAGPGFINLRLRRQWIQAHLLDLLSDPRLGVAPSDTPQRVVIDYSAPNVAKEMHVGHLRSTVIGDALARMLRFMGHEVSLQNHIGDWGTPFGMLIEHVLDEGWDSHSGEHSISDLNDFYQAARAKFDADPGFAERARQRVVCLQNGDSATLALWRDLVGESERHFGEVYELLGVLLEPSDMAGESTYNDQLSEVIDELQTKGLTVLSDGALCVFPKGFTGRDGEPTPLIVRKSDGGYSYATTDLAAIRHRIRDLLAQRLLYVVGAPQRLHLEMVFAVAREAGWLTDSMQAKHVSFGSVLGEDGKMLRTRTGAPVRLVDLLREAITRAANVLGEREPDAAKDQDLAHSIGIGAVKYADLSSDRDKDYIFSFERMLALEGNTSVYLQYANARAQSVLRRAGNDRSGERRITLREDAERELAVTLIRLAFSIDAALEDYKPHKLCTYLHSVAVAFSSFYEGCPILGASEPDLRTSRLLLCELTSRVLTLGLCQLGIQAPERLSSAVVPSA